MSCNLSRGQALHFEFLLLYDSTCPMCCSFLRLLDVCIDSNLASVDVCACASYYASINTNLQKLKSDEELICLDQKVKDTIVVVDLRDGGVRYRSAAILLLLSCTKSPFLRAVSCFKYIPRRVSDNIYKIIARNRLSISEMLGFRDVCTRSFRVLNLYIEP